MRFIAELRRRNVLRMAGLYLVGAWLVVQVASTLLPAFDAPSWSLRTIIIALAIGFLPALIFAWVFELTPEGLRRDEGPSAPNPVAPKTARRLDRAIIVVLACALAYFATDKFVLAPHRVVHGDATSAAPSIAVLPLVNTSGDASNEYFSDGMSDELIATLGKVEGFVVIGRSSSFRFKGSTEDPKTIAAQLGVAYLLEGSVRKAADQVRISVDLVHASNGRSVWSDTFDGQLADVFALQSKVATSVAAHLRDVLGLGPADATALQPDAPPSRNVDAYSAYLKGQFHYARNNAADYEKSIEAFETAVRLDPRYAKAWARLAMASTILAANYLDSAASKSHYDRAREAIRTALDIDPNLALAYLAKSNLLITDDFDFRGSEAAARRAVELDSSSGEAKTALAAALRTLGRINDALVLDRESARRDPVTAARFSNIGLDLMILGRFDEADVALRHALELTPTAGTPRNRLLWLLVLRNDGQTLIREAQIEKPTGVWGRFIDALVAEFGADRKAADAALQTFIHSDADAMAYQIAELYAARGERDEMFRWLDHAVAVHDPGATFVLFDPLTQRYRDDPRYAAVVARLGLPIENLANSEVVPYRGR